MSYQKCIFCAKFVNEWKIQLMVYLKTTKDFSTRPDHIWHWLMPMTLVQGKLWGNVIQNPTRHCSIWSWHITEPWDFSRQMWQLALARVSFFFLQSLWYMLLCLVCAKIVSMLHTLYKRTTIWWSVCIWVLVVLFYHGY